MSNKREEKLSKLYSKIYDIVSKDLESKYGYKYYYSNIGNAVDNAINNYLDKLLENETIVNQLIKLSTKEIIQDEKEKERQEKERHNKNIKLWKITKGKIPCINQCGYYRNSTKNEVMEGFNTFMCKECQDKIGDDHKICDAMSGKSIYKVLGIE